MDTLIEVRKAASGQAGSMSEEWNAEAYHRVSAPQTEWGRRVLTRLALAGDERVIDAGCGTGRITGELLERLPRGKLIAIDRSWNMLITARANLRPTFGPHVRFAQVDLPAMPFHEWADVVFSTATFHWVSDHPRLFSEILQSLKPGGRLFAQCGGGPNLQGARAIGENVMRRPPFAPYFARWTEMWEFATPQTTAARLQAAGFVEVRTSLEPATTTLEDDKSYREFVSTVIYNSHLARLPEGPLRTRFIDEVTALAAWETPSYTLDYWRLNLEGRRP